MESNRDDSFVVVNPPQADKSIQTTFTAEDLLTVADDKVQRGDKATQDEEEMDHSGGGVSENSITNSITNPRVLQDEPVKAQKKSKKFTFDKFSGRDHHPQQQHNTAADLTRPPLKSSLSHPPPSHQQPATAQQHVQEQYYTADHSPGHSAPTQLTRNPNSLQTNPQQHHSTAHHLPPVTTERAILLLGKTGAGKATIGQHVFNFKQCNILGSIDSATRTPTAYYFPSQFSDYSVKVRVVDTNGFTNPARNPKGIHRSNSPRSQQRYVAEQRAAEKKLPVNGIFFVLRHGRVTKEDCNPFHEIMDAICSISNIRSICYLIITGCEGLDQSGIESLKLMYKEDEMTKKICGFVKDVLFVGFPDLDAMLPDLQDSYKKGIEMHKIQLEKLVHQLCSKPPSFLIPYFTVSRPQLQPKQQHASEQFDPLCAMM